ncbi:hypothetical protein MTO96_016966 [Rhipicephalus appendiculatus]
MRHLADGGKGPKGRPRAPQQRRVVDVDNRDEDALAAFAESTARGGIAPADGTSTSQAELLLQSIYRQDEAENRGIAFNDAEYDMDLPDFGPQRHAEATYALLEARCDRQTELENHRLQLEEDRLRFEMKRHDRELKLKQLELLQRHAEQEAKFRLKELELQQRQLELEALAEERRHNKAYHEAQLEIIKLFIKK